MLWIRTLLFLLLFTLSLSVFARSEEEEAWRFQIRIYTFIFWGVVISAWYVYYKYQKARDKKRFLESSFIRAVFYPLAMVFLVVGLVNFIAPKGYVQPKEPVQKKEIYTLESEAKWREKVENDFLNPDNSYEYIKTHYSIKRNYDTDFEIVNYYEDRTNFDEENYRDIGNLGLAYCYFKLGKQEEILVRLNKIADKKLKYVNYLKGCNYLDLYDTAKAIVYLNNEVKMFGAQNPTAILVVSEVYRVQKNYTGLYELNKNYSAILNLSKHELRKIYIANNDIFNYAVIQMKLIFENVTITIALFSLLISFIWIFYLYKLDLFEKEKYQYILFAFILGSLNSFFAFPIYDFYEIFMKFDLNDTIWNDLLYSIFAIGAIEEFIKITPLFFILLFTKEINEPYDYIFYACVSALGFAFVENLMYLSNDSYNIIAGRFFYAAIGHLCDSAIVAYGLVLGRYKYKNKNTVFLFITTFITACVIHGLYDFFLFQKMPFLTYLILLFEVGFFVVIINNCLNNALHFTYEGNPHNHKLEFILSVSLIGVLLFQYTVNAFQYGIGLANQKLFDLVLFGLLIVPYLLYKLSRLDLVKGHWFGYYSPIKNEFELASPHGSSDYRPVGPATAPFVLGIVNLFKYIVGDSIKPNNYVHANIYFKADGLSKLRFILKEELYGNITDRLVLKFRAKGKIKKNPYWFLLKLKTPIQLQEGSFDYLYVKFKYNSIDLYQDKNTEAFIFIPKITENTKELTQDHLICKGKILINSALEG